MPAPTTARAQRPPVHPPRSRRDPDQLAEPCHPKCIVCGRPEGRGLCTPRCAILCRHVAQPGRAEVCLVTTRVTARLVTGAVPDRRLAVVDRCPCCGRLHWHSPAFGLHYRVSGCGQPYLVYLPRPRITVAEPVPSRTAAADRGARLARRLLAGRGHA